MVQNIFISHLADMITMTKGWTLLIVEVKCQGHWQTLGCVGMLYFALPLLVINFYILRHSSWPLGLRWLSFFDLNMKAYLNIFRRVDKAVRSDNYRWVSVNCLTTAVLVTPTDHPKWVCKCFKGPITVSVLKDQLCVDLPFSLVF